MTSTMRTVRPLVLRARVPDTPEPALRAACVRIREDFPDAPDGLVEALMLEAFDRTSNARVDAFRVVLAEREARSRLRRARSLGAPAGATRLDAVGNQLGF
jgi:hypothetical protein